MKKSPGSPFEIEAYRTKANNPMWELGKEGYVVDTLQSHPGGCHRGGRKPEGQPRERCERGEIR